MTAPTLAVEWLLARAAVRSTGLLHVVSRRDSGALNPVCGANPIRSTTIDERTQLDDLAMLCPGCATMAASFGGTVRDGVAMLLGLSTAPTTVRLLELPITEIHLSDAHARREPGDVDHLVASITERGIVTPIIVRRDGDAFEVIDGGRRVLAAHRAGRTTVPAVVRDASDADALIDALVANLHRQDLNVIDQAHAYRHALDTLGLNQQQLAIRLAISQPQVSNTLRLLALPEEVQDLVASGALGAAHAREILKVDDEAAQVALAAEIAEQGLTVKEAAERRGGAAPVAPRADFSQLLAGLRDARMLVTLKGDRARITIDVLESDVEGLLEQLRGAA